MANRLFVAYKSAQMGNTGAPTLPILEASGDIRLVLIDSADVTINTQTHDFLDDISAGIVATAALANEAVNLSGETAAFDSDDPTFTAVTGDQAEQMVLYNHTGGADNARLLLCLFDTFTSGMPVTPNGGDILVSPNATGWWTQ